jgi:hypothetical protein
MEKLLMCKTLKLVHRSTGEQLPVLCLPFVTTAVYTKTGILCHSEYSFSEYSFLLSCNCIYLLNTEVIDETFNILGK